MAQRPSARRAAAFGRWVTVATVAAVAFTVPSACSGSPDDTAGTTASRPPRIAGEAAATDAARHRTQDAFGDGVAMSDWLPLRGLRVRALDYRRAAVTGAAAGTRVDVITVEECASAKRARVDHRSWRLVARSGRTLGAAGGKIVNGTPTEDFPRTLSAGQCVETTLAVGVPRGSVPVTARDGPDDAWVLAD
ncbi:MAG: hypothetical protein QOK39_1975 [Acidimicrobiaceae bacterium]|nr:hypothetical protein [Acidimicrobiaceae bacterium]